MSNLRVVKNILKLPITLNLQMTSKFMTTCNYPITLHRFVILMIIE